MSIEVTLRPFRPEDYPRLAEIRNLWEPETVTAEELEEEDGRMDPKGFLRRDMACLPNGQVIGYASAQMYSDDPPGQWWITVALDTPWRGQGLADRLLRPMIETAHAQGGRVARDYCREDDLRAKRFAERIGGTFVESMFDSVLDPCAVDEELLTRAAARLDAQGLRLLRLSDVGTDEPALRRLHALYAPIEADMPGIYHGWERPYDNFIREVVRNPAFRPDGVLIAADGDAWIGLSIVNEKEGRAFNQTTGVLPAYRNRGIATGLKAHTIRWARGIGAKTIRTYNHSSNAGMLAINRKLGYVPEPGWTCYELDIDRYVAGRVA